MLDLYTSDCYRAEEWEAIEGKERNIKGSLCKRCTRTDFFGFLCFDRHLGIGWCELGKMRATAREMKRVWAFEPFVCLRHKGINGRASNIDAIYLQSMANAKATDVPFAER